MIDMVKSDPNAMRIATLITLTVAVLRVTVQAKACAFVMTMTMGITAAPEGLTRIAAKMVYIAIAAP